MADATIRVQTVLKPVSNIAKDFVTNTMHFRVAFSIIDPPVPPDKSKVDQCNEVMNALEAFYEDIRSRLGGLSIDGHVFKCYDLGESEPRIPVVERSWAFTSAPPASMLPAECSVVASFEAERQSGLNQASRRNRIYIGPLASSVSEGDGRVSDGARIAINNAMNDLYVASDSAGLSQWQWVTYSPKLGTWANVHNGHVDNAFDTQRRRGVESTVRSTWTAT